MKKLIKDLYFSTPIYSVFDDSFVNELTEITDSYIQKSKNYYKTKLKLTSDFGLSYSSGSLIPNQDVLDFQKVLFTVSHTIMNDMGYDLTNYQMFINELWVQEFASKGGGHQSVHNHWNGHVSGFYFLKAGELTSQPVFHDPRVAKTMNDLPLLDKTKVNEAQGLIHYSIEPGTMIFFPSWLTHSFSVDSGKQPFRFIHWNIQAVNLGVFENGT